MVSVIVPVYNTEAYLPQCLDSICGQTLKDLEIILVDDGSTDRSGEICDGYAAKDSRIVVIHKENGGQTSARNAGLRIAHGEYVGYVDSDDWIDPSMYEDMLSAALWEQADIVISPGYYKEKDSGSIACIDAVPAGVYKKEDQSIDTVYRCLIYSENFGSGIDASLGNKLFSRSLLSKIQFDIDTRIIYGEDDACTYSCCASSECTVVLENIFYHYRMRAQSIVHRNDYNFAESILLLYSYLKKSFSSHPAEALLMGKLNRLILIYIVQGINEKFDLGFGIVVPYHFLPQGFLREHSGQRIALYGAGGVGQSYWRLFQLAEAVEIAAWVDRQWERYRADGLSTEPVSVLAERDYDVILIAVLSAEVAERIRADLLKMGIPAEKIYYGKPRNLMQTV